jgi:hypothetical protein
LGVNSEFGEGRHQFPAERATDYGFIAGEFTVEAETGAGEPHQRMEPQGAQGEFIQQANQVVATAGVSEFMDEDGAEFAGTEKPIDADGKKDSGIENTANSGYDIFVAEADRNTFGDKAGRRISGTHGALRFATLTKNASD